MTEQEMIAFVLQPDLLELRAPEGAEWVLKFCNSMIERIQAGTPLSDRMRYTLEKCYREAKVTEHYVTLCRATPAPAATFEAMLTAGQISVEQLRPHVVYAIRQGVA